MNQKNNCVPISRAVLCVLLCVIFTALTTYQFCYYSIFTDHKKVLGETTTAMKEEYDLLLSGRDAQIASLSARLETTEEERASLAVQVNALTERMVKLTGSVEGSAEDCLRLLLQAALERQSNAAGALRDEAATTAAVEAYLNQYATDALATAERLLFVDFLYRTNYLDEAPTAATAEEAMLEAYIRAAGDMYANYYTPEEYLAFADQMNASIRCGIGVVSMQDPAGDAVLVLHVHSSSPAMESGLQAGDRIVGVDGSMIADLGYDAVVALIAGEPGTSLTLTIERMGEMLTVACVRRAVEADVLLTRTYVENGKKLGYIRLLSFNNRTAEQLRAALATMQEEGVEGLIFDVRDNTGGSLTSILDVLDIILPSGKLLISFAYGNEDNAREPLYSETDEAVELPIVVLQNRNTASAAELFCATLRDHGYATLIGETTHGKGSMQTGYKLSNGAYLTVTVASYLPPSGKSYHGIGLEPDIAAPLAPAYATLSVYLLPKEQDAPLQAALAALGESYT